MAENRPKGTLEVLDSLTHHTFATPSKCINEGEDVNFWLTSWAYTDLMTFILQLNAAMFPFKTEEISFQVWRLDDTTLRYSDAVNGLRTLIRELETIIQEAPPDPGPRRFGNVSFRTWYKIVEERLDALMEKYVPERALRFASTGSTSPKDELRAYLLGSFGSAQRLDYGSGHELSFIAFLGCTWKLGGFSQSGLQDEAFGVEERGIVLGVIEPYV
jgi:serine/threonine-protein phosphatase 2A activator